MKIKVYNKDCLELINSQEFKDYIKDKRLVIVSDPPFNIGYHYNEYKDHLKEDDYFEFLEKVFTTIGCPFVVIHYAEELFKLSIRIKKAPTKVVSWVYNSNTAKQHREIAFYDIKPNFNQVKQPYKNPNDKRIKQRIKEGKIGCKLYDWWNINQVKNVSKKGNSHPCVMPLEVMKNVIGILPKESVIFDPFMGSGTTGIACKELGYDFIGCELNQEYYELAKERINGEQKDC